MTEFHSLPCTQVVKDVELRSCLPKVLTRIKALAAQTHVEDAEILPDLRGEREAEHRLDGTQLLGSELPGPADHDAAAEQWAWLNATVANSTATYLVVGGHYPILSICEHGPTKLLQLRNPWARGEWQGPWSRLPRQNPRR